MSNTSFLAGTLTTHLDESFSSIVPFRRLRHVHESCSTMAVLSVNIYERGAINISDLPLVRFACLRVWRERYRSWGVPRVHE